MIDDLYSARILGLAANLPHLGRLDAADGSAEKTAKLCGSRIHVDLCLDHGVVSAFAQDVQACALGQASAAILGESVIGATPDELILARDGLSAMLRNGSAPPEGRFAGLSMLAPVKDYPARHASTLLAFEAAVEACQKAIAAASTRTSGADAA
jgi:NifU-like protein involved in Fe-S cluster formation